MKIKTIEVNNFRKIDKLAVNVCESGMTIIDGDNELGKSSLLSSVMWFFTDTLLTDKWGSGENDTESIIPVGQTISNYKPTSVSITFVDNVGVETKFTKAFNTKFNSRTGKPSGHNTSAYIGEKSCKSVNDWEDELFAAVGYTPAIKGVKLLNIELDPLYALQKMEAKELRTFLIQLGCSVSIYDVLSALEPERDLTEVRNLLPMYCDDLYAMRKAFKVKVKECEERKNVYQNQLSVYKDVIEFDDNALTEIDEELSALRKKYYSINDDESEKIIHELESKVINQSMIIEAEERALKTKIKSEIEVLESKIIVERGNVEKAKNERISSLNTEYVDNEKELKMLLSQVDSYTRSLNNIQRSLETSSSLGKKYVDDMKSYSYKLNEAKCRTYSNYVSCPNCFNQFVLNPDDERMFNINKQNDIEKYSLEISKCSEEINKQKELFVSLKNQRNETQLQLDNLLAKKITLESNANNIRYKINEINLSPIDTSALDELNAKKFYLSKELTTTKVDSSYLEELKLELEKAKTNASAIVFDKKNELATVINELDAKRTTLTTHKSNWESKKKYQQLLNEAIKNWNDTESVLNLINMVIHKNIEMCNKKALEKTGLNFVMLEETLSETIKEVCYLTIDGVPFKDVNTSKKAIYGTMFIKKVKEILHDNGTPMNTLPILFDRIESISNKTLEKNKDTFSNIQFICTRVTDDEKMIINYKELK